MTDADLSKSLALALGYAPESVRKINLLLGHGIEVYGIREPYFTAYWKRFDYRDPTVCLPLIEWLMREHVAKIDHGDSKYWVEINNFADRWASADTLAEAVALAVIAVKGGG